MKYNFLIYAEKKLNNEALRIFPMAKKTFFQGKSVSSLIQKMIKKEYSYYWCDIEMRIYHYLEVDKYNVKEDPKKRYFDQIKHLKRYSYFCREELKRNHRVIAHEVSKKMIYDYNQNIELLGDLLEIVSNYVNKVASEIYNDPVDIRTIMMFLEHDIERSGYKVTSLSPFQIIKKDV